MRLIEENTGFIDITNNYFDFHESLFKPSLVQRTAFEKVHDDKLMEIKFDRKQQ